MKTQSQDIKGESKPKPKQNGATNPRTNKKKGGSTKKKRATEKNPTFSSLEEFESVSDEFHHDIESSAYPTVGWKCSSKEELLDAIHGTWERSRKYHRNVPKARGRKAWIRRAINNCWIDNKNRSNLYRSREVSGSSTDDMETILAHKNDVVNELPDILYDEQQKNMIDAVTKMMDEIALAVPPEAFHVFRVYFFGLNGKQSWKNISQETGYSEYKCKQFVGEIIEIIKTKYSNLEKYIL